MIDELTRLVRKTFEDGPTGPFQPFADYNPRLDAIEIQIRECSYTVTAIHSDISILQDNYPENEEMKEIGFFICGAKSFCEGHKLISNGKVLLRILLDVIEDHFPEWHALIQEIKLAFPDGEYRIVISS